MNGCLKEVMQLILREKESNKNEDKKNEVTVRNDGGQEPNYKNEDERDKEDKEMVKDKETDDSKVQVLCLPQGCQRRLKKPAETQTHQAEGCLQTLQNNETDADVGEKPSTS